MSFLYRLGYLTGKRLSGLMNDLSVLVLRFLKLEVAVGKDFLWEISDCDDPAKRPALAIQGVFGAYFCR